MLGDLILFALTLRVLSVHYMLLSITPCCNEVVIMVSIHRIFITWEKPSKPPILLNPNHPTTDPQPTTANRGQVQADPKLL